MISYVVLSLPGAPELHRSNDQKEKQTMTLSICRAGVQQGLVSGKQLRLHPPSSSMGFDSFKGV